jgi:hypothetical protein
LGTPNAAALAGGLCAVIAGPTISDVTPDDGSVAGLTTVTVSGTNLSTTTSVTFGTQAATIDSKSATSDIVTSPAGTGTVNVTVNNPASSATDPDAFTYFVPPPPTITSISPAQGPTAGNTLVTVTGTNLESVTGVSFGSAAGGVYSDPDAGTSVVVVSPPGPAGSPVSISVTTAGGSATDDAAFSYVAPVANPYTPLSPVRICDTRPSNPSGLSGTAAQCNGAGSGDPLAPGVPLSIEVAGFFDVPADASAVVLNVTAISSATSGYVSVYPADQVPPTASNLNFSAGRTVPNLVEAGLGAGGEVSLISNTSVNVVVDLEGYAGPPTTAGEGLYNPLATPARICDTRAGNPSGLSPPDTQCDGDPLAAGTPFSVQVEGDGAVPSSGVEAVVLNVTVVGPSGQGYLSAFPQGTGTPTASNVNYLAGQTVSNRVIVPVSTTGAISLYASRDTNAIVDVSGWYSGPSGTGTEFVPLAAPVRICDTRGGNPSGLSGGAAQCNGGGAGTTLSAGATVTVTVTGLAGVPTGTGAVVLNVTAIKPSSQTYLTVYPGSPRPVVSDINPAAGTVKANLVVASLSAGGTVTIYNFMGAVNIAVDVAGYYETAP